MPLSIERLARRSGAIGLCALIVAFGWQGIGHVARGAEHTKDSLETVKSRIKEKKAIFIDVREKKEWEAGHLENARFLPLSELKKGVERDKLVKLLGKKKEMIYYVHCAAGGRCLPAAEILRKQGYDVRPLKAGYKELTKAGFPSAKPGESAKSEETTSDDDR